MSATTSLSGPETLIIALDFGTAYSGVAYAFSSKPDEIHTVIEWPGARGKTMLKCPTLIKYNEAGGFLWGYEIDRLSEDCIESVKLLLDPAQAQPLYLPPEDTEARIKKLGKPATDVAADFIEAILKHAYSKIESKYPEGYLNLIKKQYVLSVPAVWSDKAKDATLRAAHNAGVSSVELIKEPEAAALFTLHHMGKKGLKPGDALVLCDAGGGTVDLISYEVVNLDPFELKELTNCSGGLAGSLVLNKRFDYWVKNIIGDKEYSTLRETNAYRRAMKSFNDDIKPQFRSQDDEAEFITFPTAGLRDQPDMGLKSDTLTVNGKDLYDIFKPVFEEINRLITEQVMSVQARRLKEEHPQGTNIRAIFLVGGFGSSEYLKEATAAAHPNIQVIQPNDAQAAIVRGAVMSQLLTEAKVIINFAPKHYGVSARSEVDPELDAGQPRKWDDDEGQWVVASMTWYIYKGDDLHRARKIEFPFTRTFKNRPQPHELIITEELKECATENAPRHPKAGVTKRNVKLTADLSGAPSSHIRKKFRMVDGKLYKWWQVDYKLVVTVNSGPMIFSCVCSGQEVGKVTAEY